MESAFKLAGFARSGAQRLIFLCLLAFFAGSAWCVGPPTPVGPLTVESGNTNHLLVYIDGRGVQRTFYELTLDVLPAHGTATILAHPYVFPPHLHHILSYASDPGYAGEDHLVFTVVTIDVGISTTTRTTNTYAVALQVLPAPPIPAGPLDVLRDARTDLFAFSDNGHNVSQPDSIVTLAVETNSTRGMVALSMGSSASPHSQVQRVSYTANPQFVGEDQFVLVVRMYTSIDPGQVAIWTTNRHVVNLRVGPPLVAGLPMFAPDGACLVRFSGTVPGYHYQVDASSDLLRWVLVTNILAQDQSIDIRDQEAIGLTRRFYRCTELPPAPPAPE